MGGKNAVKSKQMARFIFIGQTGLGIVSLPAVLAREAGHDGWISVLLSGLIAMVLSAIIVVLLRRYADKNIMDINQLLYGKIAGTIINVLLFIYLLFLTALGVRVFMTFLRMTLFTTTPVLVLTPFILMPSFYMIWQGMKTVARFKAVTLIAYAILLLYLMLIYQEYRPSFLMPVGEAGVLPIVMGMRSSYVAFIGLELVAFFYNEITDKENVMKYMVIANLATTIFCMLIVLACTAVFGAHFTSVQTIPLFNLSRIYHAPVLERVDLYIVTAWFLVIGCSLRAFLMAAYYSISKILKKDNSKPIFIAFILAVIGLSRVPRDLSTTFQALDIINYAGMGVAIFLILSLIISMFRKNGVKNYEVQQN